MTLKKRVHNDRLYSFKKKVTWVVIIIDPVGHRHVHHWQDGWAGWASLCLVKETCSRLDQSGSSSAAVPSQNFLVLTLISFKKSYRTFIYPLFSNL